MKPHELPSGGPEEPTDGSEVERSIKEKREEEGAAGAQTSPTEPLLNIPSILLEDDHPSGDPGVSQGLKERTSPGPASKDAPSEAKDLPQAYDTGRLWLVARDPHCLYMRWDLTDEAQQQYRVRAHDNALVVKICPENQPSQAVSRIQVTPDLRHSFVHVDVAGCNYVAELGYYTPQGEWTPVSVSEPARTPVETVAEPGGVQFATFGVEQPIETRAEQTKLEAEVHPVPPGQGKGTLSEPQPVRADLPPQLAAGGILSGAAQVGFAEPGFQQGQGAAAVQLERPLRPELKLPTEPQQWTTAQEQALARLIEWSLVQRRWPGSAEVAEVISGRRRDLVSAQAAQLEFPVVGEVPSSPVGGGLPAIPGFWFNLNAELVVYGATERNAQVTLGGRLVQLREDGTFSLRFALPDGSYVLSASAYSASGEVRRAELEFERRSRYYGEVGVQPQDPAIAAPTVRTAT